MSANIVRATTDRRIMDQWLVNQLVQSAAGDDEPTKAVLHQEIRGFATDLAGPNPTPIVRVLADAAATTWFGARVFEARYLAAIESDAGLSIKASEHHQRRIERAHRRLLVTLKTLAAVRRLGAPAVQINVAHQQVNVAGPTDLPGTPEHCYD